MVLGDRTQSQIKVTLETCDLMEFGTCYMSLLSDSCFGDGNAHQNLSHHFVSESCHIFGLSGPLWKMDIVFGIASSISSLDDS